MEKKYEMVWNKEKMLNQAKALKDFTSGALSIKKGDLGPLITKEENLSQEGNAWGTSDSSILGDAHIYGDTLLLHSNVSGKIDIWGTSQILFSNIKAYETDSNEFLSTIVDSFIFHTKMDFVGDVQKSEISYSEICIDFTTKEIGDENLKIVEQYLTNAKISNFCDFIKASPVSNIPFVGCVYDTIVLYKTINNRVNMSFKSRGASNFVNITCDGNTKEELLDFFFKYFNISNTQATEIKKEHSVEILLAYLEKSFILSEETIDPFCERWLNMPNSIYKDATLKKCKLLQYYFCCLQAIFIVNVCVNLVKQAKRESFDSDLISTYVEFLDNSVIDLKTENIICVKVCFFSEDLYNFLIHHALYNGKKAEYDSILLQLDVKYDSGILSINPFETSAFMS